MNRLWLVAGSLNMLLALLVAAATGHGAPAGPLVEARLALETARELHLVHALALLMLGGLPPQQADTRLLTIAGSAFLVGIALFPCGIYASRILGFEVIRPLVPVGGMAFMLGWVLMAGAFMRDGRPIR